MAWFTAIFLAALVLATGMRLYLARRQIAHVRRHRSTVPAAFADTIGLAAHQKAADYTCERTRLGVFAAGVDALVLLALTLGGGLAFIDRTLAGFVPPGVAQGIALIALTTILLSLIDLPFAVYRTFGIEARHGFNRMTPKLFVIDLLKGAAVSMVLGLPLIALVLWLMQKAGPLWWLYAWFTWAAFNLFLLAVYPTWIAPIFNKFAPMQDAALAERIGRLLSRCGFRAQGLFVMDGSTRSTHGNAYFTGFGATKRIVFFDTLLERLTHAEIEAVLAHELGHFKLRHIVKRIVWLFGLSFAGAWALGVLLEAPWFFSGLGVGEPATAMGLLLFFLVLPTFTFLLHPLGSLYSRRHEFEADRYAATIASGADLKNALIKLYKDNASTLTPDPLHSAFYDSHPPAAIRIARLEAAA